jgi:hypothetical protein
MAAMPRLHFQFRHSTLLWIALAVACFFGGMAVQRRRAGRLLVPANPPAVEYDDAPHSFSIPTLPTIHLRSLLRRYQRSSDAVGCARFHTVMVESVPSTMANLVGRGSPGGAMHSTRLSPSNL